MPKRNPQIHNAESIKLVVSRLEKMLGEIGVSLSIMEEEPPLKSVEVEWQNALDVGLSRLRTWTDALRDAVDNKRMDVAVSDSPVSTAKPRKKKL
jgi:hypothetical protein